ncbi:hypothetical protein B0I35DRAFT_412535 [Stachybotrys elegans]|uniref:Arginase n=1 Tax=Stachybotrys elegans TaxID=80388 RepID=A0A8K0SJY2_9HYPO|nr:hypothetical protein B0I35DRAFT_412535 [Stachybotrys elegans]
MAPAKSVTVICSPYHLGIRDLAVGAGPSALLEAGLLSALRDLGIRVEEHELEAVDEFEGDISKLFELIRRTSLAVSQAIKNGSFPIVLAGNCSATVGVQAGVNAARGSVPACIWFDAHDDFNTPDVLASGYLDSMPLAMMGGLCWKTLLTTIPGFQPLNLGNDIIHCSMRDVTDLERARVKQAGFPVIWGDADKHVDFEGQLRGVLQDKEFQETMVHLDLDALDTSVGKAGVFDNCVI